MNWIEKKWYNSQLNKIKKSVKLLKEFNEIMYNMTEEQKRELDKEKEKIRKMSLSELIELFEELIEELKKNI